MLSVDMRGVGERSFGGGVAVTIKSYLESIPFDLPAHQSEETPGMNGLNWFDQTWSCLKL